MIGRRRRSTASPPYGRRASLVALILVLLLCVWLLYRLFIGIPGAPPPEVKTALAVSMDGRDKNVAPSGGWSLVGGAVK